MKTMKVNYTAGCVACPDGIYDHVTELMESGTCTSIRQASEFVADAINKTMKLDLFNENKVRKIYNNGKAERGLVQSEPPNDGTTGTSDTKSVDSVTETMPTFDVQARQEAVKQDRQEPESKSICSKRADKPESVETPVTIKDLEYKLFVAKETSKNALKQLSDMREKYQEANRDLEEANKEVVKQRKDLKEQKRQNGILALALHDAEIPYDLS